MKDFANISFKGVFRDYQQRVLDNKNKYLINGKINIVAAPGSGKTILGLELIRQLNSPTIILSPTTTIKHQWGERFEQSFLPDDEKMEDYVSYDLNEITLINSITYQALYSAINKIKCESEDETIDYSNLNLFQLIKEYNVKTICLDEAHHLQNEWQKALEKFILGLDKDVKIVALTATPPYDASKSEWERYIKVCGEIDEEIFVPELVAEKTLCPHQDYIYFNYPTEEELISFADYRNRVFQTLIDIKNLSYYEEIFNKINSLFKDKSEYLYEYVKPIVALLVLLSSESYDIDIRLIKALVKKDSLPSFNLQFAETAVQFLLDDEYLVNPEQKETIIKVLKTNGTLESKKVCFSLKESLKKKLISSVGKLQSIASITESEAQSMKDELRLLILTDFIRKESLKDVGTDHLLNSINIVTIFETLRRKIGGEEIGVLSGGLVILPTKLSKKIPHKHTLKEIENTDYAIYSFSNFNKIKVEIVSKLFEEGKIKILIGTKSLLGEGWDSPCINTLILATFVGSFMLSNQMRGRAIRKNPKVPNKKSNIWHLVTLEPEYLFKDKLIDKIAAYKNYDRTKINSYDYEILEKRFDSFVGPNYENGEIESGIARITLIQPPFNASNINNINQEMLIRANNRDSIKENWENSLKHGKELSIEAEVPSQNIIPPKTFFNVKGIILASLIETCFFVGVYSGFTIVFEDPVEQVLYLILMFVLLIGGGFALSILTKKVIERNSYTKVLKRMAIATLKTLQEMGQISYEANVKVMTFLSDTFVNLALGNASIREQNIFNTAMNELLGYIENPRYVLIMKNNYEYSFACPTLIGQKKENVELYIDYLKRNLAPFTYSYTRSEEGREILLKCRHKSFITYTEKYLKNRKKIVNYE